MTFTRQSALVFVAIVLFVVAFLIAVDALDGNETAWETGGLAVFAASFFH
jgi:hypothetical protein